MKAIILETIPRNGTGICCIDSLEYPVEIRNLTDIILTKNDIVMLEKKDLRYIAVKKYPNDKNIVN